VTFSEKLDMLLRVTNTPNNLLAKALSLDPSYISRLRHGGRKLSCGEYIEKMAAFFSHRCMEEYILSALASAMENREIQNIKTEDELEKKLVIWLAEEPKKEGIKTLFKDFSQRSNEESAKKTAIDREAKSGKSTGLMMFYGNEGRRQATLTLFNKLLANDKPGMLLLFSDENSEWMLESEAFEREWTTLLWQLILKGNKIKVIHKVSRDIDEMMEVVHRWLPFYTSGAVEPFYYPRLRDGIYKRTLTVAPGCAAVFATSIGEGGENTPNFMATDRLTVDSFTNEFFSYLSLCRPLMKIHSESEPVRALPELYDFIVADGSIIMQTDSLGMITIPPEAVEAAIKDKNNNGSRLAAVQKKWTERFEEKLKEQDVYHIIHLHDIDSIKSGKISMGFTSNEQQVSAFYSADTYRMHLENILRLIDENSNYHVIAVTNDDLRYSMYCKEDEVRVFKDDDPPIMFEITEQNMVSAFGDYFEQETVQGYSERVRKKTEKTIKEFIAELSS
jgi:hypothetical protein